MSNAQERGWGDPDAAGYRQKHIVTITLNCGVKLHVRREVARLFKGFFDELEAVTGYSLADQGQPDDWGYANRDIRGRPGVKSNHSWGLAVDANAEENPMTAAHGHHAGQPGHDHRGVHTDMPPETAKIAAKWGLRWGANYTVTADAMHFEFEGTPADVARYPNPAAPAKPPPPPPPQEDDDMPALVRRNEPNHPLDRRWYKLEGGHRRWVDDDDALAQYRNPNGPRPCYQASDPDVPQNFLDGWPPLEQGRDD